MILVFFFDTGVITENMVCSTHSVLCTLHHSLNNWFEAFPHSPRVLDGIAKLHSPLLLV